MKLLHNRLSFCHSGDTVENTASYNRVIGQIWLFSRAEFSTQKSSFSGVCPNECFINDLCFNKQEKQMSVGYDTGVSYFKPPLFQDI